MDKEIYSRKIQLVGNTTYSISLPKEWVTENKLKEKDSLTLKKTSNNNLIIDLTKPTKEESKSTKVCIDKLQSQIRPLLFSLYYQGYEDIEIYSTKELDKKTRRRIRAVMGHLSGTVIEQESSTSIKMKVLLNETKMNAIQMLYRICMVIDLLFDNLIENYSISEVQMNENEIDRVYHLFTKTISLLLNNPSLMKTTGITKMSLIPSYIILSRKLENLGDELKKISEKLFQDIEECKKHKKLIMYFHEKFKRIVEPVVSMKRKNVEKEGVVTLIDRDEKTIPPFERTLKILKDIQIESQIISISR